MAGAGRSRALVVTGLLKQGRSPVSLGPPRRRISVHRGRVMRGKDGRRLRAKPISSEMAENRISA